MHAIPFLAVRPIFLYLGTNLIELLSSNIIVTSKRDFERSGVSMSRKTWVDLISFHLISYVNMGCHPKAAECDIPSEEAE